MEMQKNYSLGKCRGREYAVARLVSGARMIELTRSPVIALSTEVITL